MVRVGIVGTGFVAQKRARAIAADARSQLVAVAGHTEGETSAFAKQYGAIPTNHWSELITSPQIDLVMICHINQAHGLVAQAALEAGKSVVVEYPLSITLAQAELIAARARDQGLLLHVAHVELLSSNHRVFKAKLPGLGPIHYARYCTLSPKRARLNHWTFNPGLFGFPLVGAQSRLHRLIDCFGPVSNVYCQNYYSHPQLTNRKVIHHSGCLCTARLTFATGTIAEVVYGKGEAIWWPVRRLEAFGLQGGIVIDNDQGEVVTSEGSEYIEIGGRRGLFSQDTNRVLDYLTQQTPLYCSAEASLYSLRVAAAAEQSAVTGQAVTLA